jgi:hypothetical protein
MYENRNNRIARKGAYIQQHRCAKQEQMETGKVDDFIAYKCNRVFRIPKNIVISLTSYHSQT